MIRLFPTVPVSKQLFYVPGAAIDGGYTSGGVSIISPEPGGRSRLDLQISLQVNEWSFPISSWIMSRTNGQVFRVRLAPTPQIISNPSFQIPWDNNVLWNNVEPWDGDLIGVFLIDALEGSNIVKIDMALYGPLLQLGHVFGYSDSCYLVDDIIYEGTVATITSNPPLRRDISAGDIVNFRPFFLGTISNGDTIRTTYDAQNVGMIQPGLITFNEAIL